MSVVLTVYLHLRVIDMLSSLLKLKSSKCPFSVSSTDGTTTEGNETTDFSDMDTFMNWNTSSSFENFEEVRQRRTQLVKRASSSAVRRKISDKDKLEDDVVNRICRDNNRTVQDPGVNPISKVTAKVKALNQTITGQEVCKIYVLRPDVDKNCS